MKKKLTLAQFKRDAATGKLGLELLERYGNKVDKHEICSIIKVKAKGVVLQRGNQESDLDLNFASLIDYDGEYLKIYSLGKRLLNDVEMMVMNQWSLISSTKEFRERAEYDALSDGSSTYYQQKYFFDKSLCPYLFTDTPSLYYKPSENVVYDAKIKGECILKYKVHWKN